MTNATHNLIARLRRFAKISYGATIEEAREVSKTLREAADLIERVIGDLPQDAIDGGWTALGMSKYAKGLEAQIETLQRERDEAVAKLEARAAETDEQSITDDNGRMRDKVRDLIEGMEVSVDVSTGDHDASHRYFGIISEVMDHTEGKHGVILLVQQDVQPNFEVAHPPTGDAAGKDSVDAARYRHEAADAYFAAMPKDGAVFQDMLLSAIKNSAEKQTDDWAEGQETEPTKEQCDAHCVREILKMVQELYK